MAFNEQLAQRVRENLPSGLAIEEKKMFGGLCFMIDDKMCCGIVKDEVMLRLDPETMDSALSKNGARPMDFTGKRMKGFIYVSEESWSMDTELRYWLDEALDYNKRVEPSKKKKARK